MYACDGESGAKGALKNCSKKGCKNCYHLDCIEMHLEATEGIDDDNWDRYNTLCLHCFQEKFELQTQHRIGNLHSEFDGNKEYVSKEKNGAELFVQNVSTKRFQIDKHRLYTDVSNKDWKVQDYFNKSLLQNYDYQVKQKTKSTNTVERCSLKPSKEDIDEAEKLFANNDEVAVSHLKYCGTRIVHEIVKEIWFGRLKNSHRAWELDPDYLFDNDCNEWDTTLCTDVVYIEVNGSKLNQALQKRWRTKLHIQTKK